MEKYFTKFPVIDYANTKAVDITERVVFTDRTLKNPYVFYPYDLDVYERPDQFAARYYNDQYVSWLLYLTNKIVDPYYEWYLSEEDFNNFIVKKYGRMELAQDKIMFYRNDWVNSENITAQGYNTLPASLQKYWTANYNLEGNYDTLNGNYLLYSRKQDDITVTTNNIRSYNISNTYTSNPTNNTFIHDEICKIVFNNTHIGNGQICYVSKDKSQIYLQHTSGTTLANVSVTITGNSYIYGTESGVNTHFTSAVSIANNIPAEEQVYFSPVTYYEYEREKNEFNKSILVLDQPFVKRVVENVKDLLS